MRRPFYFILVALAITSVVVWIPILRNVRGEIARINPDPFNPMAILESGERPAIAEGSERNCTYSDYYWTLNTERWPNTIVINDISYSREEGLELLSTDKEEVSEWLLRNLIVAYLNIYKGADMSTITDTIIDSETWLAGIPDDSHLSNFRRHMGLTLAVNLGAYNNGFFGPDPCPNQPEPPEPTSTPTVTPTPTHTPSASTGLQDAASQLQLFFENLFSMQELTPTPTLTPIETPTRTSPPPENNQPSSPPEDDPPPQPVNTPVPPVTDTQPPPPTNTQPPPPTDSEPPSPTEPQRPSPTETERPPQNDNGGNGNNDGDNDNGNGNGSENGDGNGNGDNGNGNGNGNGDNGNGNGNGDSNGNGGGNGNGNDGGNGNGNGNGNGDGNGNGNGNGDGNGNGNGGNSNPVVFLQDQIHTIFDAVLPEIVGGITNTLPLF